MSPELKQFIERYTELEREVQRLVDGICFDLCAHRRSYRRMKIFKRADLFKKMLMPFHAIMNIVGREWSQTFPPCTRRIRREDFVPQPFPPYKTLFSQPPAMRPHSVRRSLAQPY